MSLEWAGTNAGAGHTANQQLSLLATVVDESPGCRHGPPGTPGDTPPAGCDGNASDYQLLLTGSFLYDRGGAATVDGNGNAIGLKAPGLRAITVAALLPPPLAKGAGTAGTGRVAVAGRPPVSVAVGLEYGSAAFSTSLGTHVRQVWATFSLFWLS